MPDLIDLLTWVSTALGLCYFGAGFAKSLWNSFFAKPVPKPAPKPADTTLQLEPEPVTKYSFEDILENIPAWVCANREVIDSYTRDERVSSRGRAMFMANKSGQYNCVAGVNQVEFGTYGISVSYMLIPEGPEGNKADSWWWDCKNDLELRTAIRRVWLLVRVGVTDPEFIAALGGVRLKRLDNKDKAD